ncbi:NHL repeat-containing protein [Bryocella elongata]|uniref:NHL repeat-containing protein n=1 Tax=Bryocella elongata TaxID=863522 RepID=A0A1H6CAC9_9BACT|nr:Ig-like domain repeat protein [Bryocella elongata]SEG69868.1 NHL repeat-containing protein [Bryocella elongata]
MKTLRETVRVGGLAVAGLTLCLSASAQGVLTVTPGPVTATTAGTGAVGYSGDGGAAVSATLASPSAVAYDSSGNLFVADAANHVIREVLASNGKIQTVAGTGVEGYSGDGGAATSAQLDTPTGIAVDTSGNLYIADSHNHRVRLVSGGTITTIAGTGAAGFSGDGAAATSAQLNMPHGVAVDASGNVYIADTNNFRVRKLSSGNITTIAGTGEQNFAGDAGAATAAALDSPVAVAVDGAGNVYVADLHNQRIRAINTSGVISTVVGSGALSFAGGFGGDGSSATAAALSRPSGVSVDAAGNLYIADSNNQRIRAVTAGGIATLAGNGTQGFAGDGGALNAASFDTPVAAVLDANGDVSVADRGNQRLRGIADSTLNFGSALVGVASATETVTLSNTGNAGLTVSSAAITGPFARTSSSTCATGSITLAASASCTLVLTFTPTTTGTVSGALALNGAGAQPQTIALSGNGTQASTTTMVVSSDPAPFVGDAVTLTATVTPKGAGTPTGTVTFYSNGSPLYASQRLANGSASVITSFSTSGTYAIGATYSGDSNYTTSTAATIVQPVGDFSFNIASGGSSTASVVPGNSAVFNFSLLPVGGPLSFPVAFSATGLPKGATATFSPATLTAGSTAQPFTMSIKTPAQSGMLKRYGPMGGGSTLAVAMLLFPFSGKRKRRLRPLLMTSVGLLSLGTMAMMTGCGTSEGFFGQQAQTYNIIVSGTATSLQGTTLVRTTSVTLTVQ